MMLAELLPEVLNSLVAKRVWKMSTPDDLPRDAEGLFLPFIIWSQMGGRDSEYIDQTMSDHSNARVQIQSVARGASAAESLCVQVRDALLASSYTVGVLGSPIGTYDTTRKLYGESQLFSIWFRQTA